MSPGWQSSAEHNLHSVDIFSALALPFFNIDMLAIVIPTLSANSVTLIFRFASITSILKIISLSTNQGLGCALNEGLKYCSNNLIVRMDTDDIAMPIRAEEQLNVFEKYPDVKVLVR